VTFYCPVELLEQVEAEMARSARSKTQVVVDGLRTEVLQLWWNARSVGRTPGFIASHGPYAPTTPQGQIEWSVRREDGQPLANGYAQTVVLAREVCRIVIAIVKAQDAASAPAS